MVLFNQSHGLGKLALIQETNSQKTRLTQYDILTRRPQMGDSTTFSINRYRESQHQQLVLVHLKWENFDQMVLNFPWCQKAQMFVNVNVSSTSNLFKLRLFRLN